MEDIILSVVMFCVLGLIVFAFGREIATYLYKVRASNPVQSQDSNPVQSKTVNLDAESQKILA